MRRAAAALVALVLALTVPACGDDTEDLPQSPGGGIGGEPENAGRQDFEATVPVEGARVVQPLAQAAATSFQHEGRTRVEVTGSDTETALAKLCGGTIAVALADRVATEDELDACAANDIELVRVPVGHHAVAVARNDALAIDCLRLDQLRRLWRPGTGVRTYAELGGALPQERVSLHGTPTRSADAELFSAAVTGSEGRLRSDYERAGSFRAFLDAVGGTAGATGFFNYEQIRQGLDGRARLVAVDEGSGCIEPSQATVQSGRYGALARPVFMYVSRQAIQRHEAVRSFARYVVEDYRQHVLVSPTLVPATADELNRAKRALPTAPVPAG